MINLIYVSKTLSKSTNKTMDHATLSITNYSKVDKWDKILKRKSDREI